MQIFSNIINNVYDKIYITDINISNLEEVLLEIIHNLLDAFNENNNGNVFKKLGCSNDFENFYREESEYGFKKAFEENIKNTDADYLAKAIIKVIKVSKYLKISIEEDLLKDDQWDVRFDYIKNRSFSKNIFSLIEILVEFYQDVALSKLDIGFFDNFLAALKAVAVNINIDILQHLELREKYNCIKE